LPYGFSRFFIPKITTLLVSVGIVGVDVEVVFLNVIADLFRADKTGNNITISEELGALSTFLEWKGEGG